MNKLVFHPESVIPKLRLENFKPGSAEYANWKAVFNSVAKAKWRLLEKQYPTTSKLAGTEEDVILAALSMESVRDQFFGNPGGAHFVERAWRQKNRRFFIRLGQALEKKPIKETPSRHALREFLVTNWTSPDARAPDLCYFSTPAMIAIYGLATGTNPLTYHAFDKEWRRELGLVRSRPTLIRTVRLKAGKILLA